MPRLPRFEFVCQFADLPKVAAVFPNVSRQFFFDLACGGALIIDNLLWSGRILDPADQSPDTEGVRAVTRRIMESSDWIASIVPVRDGVLVAYRT